MSRRRPNVIVFLTDQQRWDTCGLHGNPLGLTPNLDRMAETGTHFVRCFTPQPLCGPARSCLQTGLYPTTTGCFTNRRPLPDCKTLGHYFREGGYRTGYIGKWHLAGEEPVSPGRRSGYDDWLGANLLEFESSAYDTVMFDGDGARVHLPGYRADALTDAAIRYIADNQDEPFFLFVSHVEPHHQNHLDAFLAPDGYADRYEGRWMPADLAALGGNAYQSIGGYFGSVKRLDEAYGRMIDALRSLGLLDDTVVAFTSDHGCHFNTRNGEYKRSCHDGTIRVPAVICGRGFQGGRRVQELVSLLDLPPTLLDAAGLPVPAEMEGRSMLALLDRTPPAKPWPDHVYIQISEDHVGRVIRTQRWKYSIRAPDGDGWTDGHAGTYVEDHLYDLEADPHELTDLAGFASHAAISAGLRSLMLEAMVAAGEAPAKIRPAPVVESGQRHVPNQTDAINRYRAASSTPLAKS